MLEHFSTANLRCLLRDFCCNTCWHRFRSWLTEDSVWDCGLAVHVAAGTECPTFFFALWQGAGVKSAANSLLTSHFSMSCVHLISELLEGVIWQLPKNFPAWLRFCSGTAGGQGEWHRMVPFDLLRHQPGLVLFSSPQVKALEETIEELLRRLDEFCGITDAVRAPPGPCAPPPAVCPPPGRVPPPGLRAPGTARGGRPSWERDCRGEGCGCERRGAPRPPGGARASVAGQPPRAPPRRGAGAGRRAAGGSCGHLRFLRSCPAWS